MNHILNCRWYKTDDVPVSYEYHLTTRRGRPIDRIIAAYVGIVLLRCGYRIEESEQKNPRVNGFAIALDTAAAAITKTQNGANFNCASKVNGSVYV